MPPLKERKSRRVLVTGAAGNSGQETCRQLVQAGYQFRRADVASPLNDDLRYAEFACCDTRTTTDVQQAVAGCEAVIHLAGHNARGEEVTKLWASSELPV